jgi:hypothetical protein
MSMFTTVLLFIAMGILAVSLFYTWTLAKGQKARGNIDSKIPTAVQDHAYIRNPVFLTYGIFFALVILVIIFFAQTTNW